MVSSTGISVTGKWGDWYRNVAFGTYTLHSADTNGKLVYARYNASKNYTLYIDFIQNPIQYSWVVSIRNSIMIYLLPQ